MPLLVLYRIFRYGSNIFRESEREPSVHFFHFFPLFDIDLSFVATRPYGANNIASFVPVSFFLYGLAFLTRKVVFAAMLCVAGSWIEVSLLTCWQGIEPSFMYVQ